MLSRGLFRSYVSLRGAVMVMVMSLNGWVHSEAGTEDVDQDEVVGKWRVQHITNVNAKANIIFCMICLHNKFFNIIFVLLFIDISEFWNCISACDWEAGKGREGVNEENTTRWAASVDIIWKTYHEKIKNTKN